jgi:pantoate--beta-alanine ligase
LKIFNDTFTLRKDLGNKQNIAFVPTMGNLHDGHIALIKHAKQHADHVVVSIFVNRLQFLPNEGFDQYPRTFDNDCKILNKLDIDYVFAPNEKTLYPDQQEFLLTLPTVADTLEGKFRPGFFCGVATVVLKLFNIVQPQLAVFGKKDYQQLHIIRAMVQQLNLPIKVDACKIMRTSDGLALSSRNTYLTQAQRVEAGKLYHILQQTKKEINSGNGSKNFESLQENAINYLTQRGWNVDYFTIQNSKTLQPAKANDENLIVLTAAWLGKTRLIDNIEI